MKYSKSINLKEDLGNFYKFQKGDFKDYLNLL